MLIGLRTALWTVHNIWYNDNIISNQKKICFKIIHVLVQRFKDSGSLWSGLSLNYVFQFAYILLISNVCLLQVTVTMAEWTATFPAVCRSLRCPAWPRSPSVSRDFVITLHYPWAFTIFIVNTLSIRDSFTCYYFEYTSTAAYLDNVRRF